MRIVGENDPGKKKWGAKAARKAGRSLKKGIRPWAWGKGGKEDCQMRVKETLFGLVYTGELYFDLRPNNTRRREGKLSKKVLGKGSRE